MHIYFYFMSYLIFSFYVKLLFIILNCNRTSVLNRTDTNFTILIYFSQTETRITNKIVQG